jgi:hypothetical protein
MWTKHLITRSSVFPLLSVVSHNVSYCFRFPCWAFAFRVRRSTLALLGFSVYVHNLYRERKY